MEESKVTPEEIWAEYGLEEFQKGMDSLFPQNNINVEALMADLLEGDVIGALTGFIEQSMISMSGSLTGIKNIAVWLIVLGVVSALVIHFVQIFDKHQVADLSFYFLYLLQAAILLKCFVNIAQTAYESMENIVLFVKLLVPTFLLAVGVASGAATVMGYYQVLVVLIYGVEALLIKAVIPMIYSFAMLAVVNGIFAEEKLVLFMELLEKGIDWVLKAVIGAVTGLSLLQGVIAPAVDSVKANFLKRQ